MLRPASRRPNAFYPIYSTVTFRMGSVLSVLGILGAVYLVYAKHDNGGTNNNMNGALPVDNTAKRNTTYSI
jgi:hypothetical protein